MTGTLISLEGLDGSGKTTLWDSLQERYADDPVTFTREPTETWYGDAVCRSLKDNSSDSLAELFLYTADHAAHLTDTIEPALDRGEVVITDRYVDSRLAYQAATLSDRFGSIDNAFDFVRDIHEPWTRYPDVTLYLDVDPAVGAKRSGETNKMEREGQLRRVKQGYDRVLNEERVLPIDAESGEDVAFEAAVEVIDPYVAAVEER